MRIAFVAPFGLRAKGTTRARVLPLAREAVRRGHDAAVFIPPYDSPNDSDKCWTDAGVTVIHAALPSRSGSPPGQLRLAWRLDRAVRGWRPELVHVFKPKGPSGLVAAMLWGRRSAPGRRRMADHASGESPALVLDADDWEGPGGWNDDPRTGYSPAQKRFFAWQERFGLSHADAWTVASTCLRDRAAAFGAAADRIFILHNAVGGESSDPSTSSGQSSATDGTSLAPAVLYTRFAGVRPAEVAAIWQRVRELLPDARLIVVGRGVAGEERELARMPGIALAGWVELPQLPALLAGMSIAIAPWADTPSNRARHSAKILELMAAGVPVVAYAVGELPATLGDAGVMAPPGDREAFARAVVDLMADPAGRRRLGLAAQARIRRDFTWPRVAEAAWAAYARATGSAV